MNKTGSEPLYSLAFTQAGLRKAGYKETKMEIDLLEENDLPAYRQLMLACFGGAASLEAYRRYDKNAGTYRIYVIKEGANIVAAATAYAVELFTFDFQPCLMIFNVAVDKACRKKGYGEQLLRHIIQTGKEAGFRSISLTCLDTAIPALRLYEKMGFQKMDSLKYNLAL